jgi:hypothetical protein
MKCVRLRKTNPECSLSYVGVRVDWKVDGDDQKLAVVDREIG